MTHEEMKNVVNDFGKSSTAVSELLRSEPDFEQADILFIENNFVTLQMAYAKWKRGRAEQRSKGLSSTGKRR